MNHRRFDMQPVSTSNGGYEFLRTCFYGGSVDGSTVSGSEKIVSCLDKSIASIADALTNTTSVTPESLSRPWNMESLFGSFYAALLIPLLLTLAYFIVFLISTFDPRRIRDRRLFIASKPLLFNTSVQTWLFIVLVFTCFLMQESFIMSEDDVKSNCLYSLAKKSVSPNVYVSQNVTDTEMASIVQISNNHTLYPSDVIQLNATNGELQDALRMRLFYACRTDPTCYETFRSTLLWAGFGTKRDFPSIQHEGRGGRYGVCAYQMEDLHPLVFQILRFRSGPANDARRTFVVDMLYIGVNLLVFSLFCKQY